MQSLCFCILVREEGVRPISVSLFLLGLSLAKVIEVIKHFLLDVLILFSFAEPSSIFDLLLELEVLGDQLELRLRTINHTLEFVVIIGHQLLHHHNLRLQNSSDNSPQTQFEPILRQKRDIHIFIIRLDLRLDRTLLLPQFPLRSKLINILDIQWIVLDISLVHILGQVNHWFLERVERCRVSVEGEGAFIEEALVIVMLIWKLVSVTDICVQITQVTSVTIDSFSLWHFQFWTCCAFGKVLGGLIL